MGKKKVGKYTIDLNNVLGKGTFATVYTATNSETGEQVAVKVLDKHSILQNEYEEKSFKQQIDIMTKLNSDYIIKCYEVNESKSNFYVFLEMAGGGELRQKMKKNGIPERECLNYLVQLMNGFGEMSKIGIIHRDIKPDNIFLKGDTLKIGDFGFSKDAGATGFMSTIVGSPAYMAPQILLEQKYTYKCDIWSLGIMAYEMMTGKIPFNLKAESRSSLKNFYNVIQKTVIEFPNNIDISQNMSNFILGCLKISEKDRFGWTDIFLHPLFQGIFNKNFEGLEKGEERLGYIMAQIRMTIHDNKINVRSRLKQLKTQSLSLRQFKDFISYLDPSLEKDDISILAQSLSKNKKITLESFSNLLEKYGCRLKQMQELCKEVDTSPDSGPQETYLLRRNIKKIIKEDDMEISDRFMKVSNHKQQIDFDQFNTLIHQLVPYVPPHDLQSLYEKDFSTSLDQKLKLDKFSKVMYRICHK